MNRVLFALIVFAAPLGWGLPPIATAKPVCTACKSNWPPKPENMVTKDTSMHPNVSSDGYVHVPCVAPQPPYDIVYYTVPAGKRFILTWLHAGSIQSNNRTLIEKDILLNETVKRGETGWAPNDLTANPNTYVGTIEGGAGFGIPFSPGSQVIGRFRIANPLQCNPGSVDKISFSLSGYLLE